MRFQGYVLEITRKYGAHVSHCSNMPKYDVPVLQNTLKDSEKLQKDSDFVVAYYYYEIPLWVFSILVFIVFKFIGVVMFVFYVANF